MTLNKVVIILLIALILPACHRTQRISMPGYIEGKYTYVSHNNSGILKSLYVNAGDTVKEGQPLFALEAVPERDDLQAATARVQEATNQKKKFDAQYTLQKTDMDRKLFLFKKGIISKEELDSSVATYRQAYADLQAADENLSAVEANERKASWTAEQMITNSPAASMVFDTFYSPGEFVPASNPVLSLLLPAQLKIIFYVPEYWLAKLKVNQKISVSCDGCNAPVEGKISYISPQAEFTPPVVYSSEESAKLVYRVEAKPQSLTTELHPGLPINVSVEIQ